MSNGARTSQASTPYGPGCATGAGTTTTETSAFDSADRPTTGAGGAGQYTYDGLGRQTTVPAVDAPNPAKGEITLAYYDSDLPQAITQAGTTTSYTLNVDGHRQRATTGPTGGAATTTTQHYSDTSDNPAWAEVSTGAVTTTTRYTPSLGGDLGASISADGTTTLALNSLHGDTLTTITIPANQDSTTNTTSIGAWSDYGEYGSPDTTAAATVAGTQGYGWLGAQQRSTTTDSAGLTRMGDRLYNGNTGQFTSLDPQPGGGANAYAYPTDPINMFDLNGQWWGWHNTGSWIVRHRGLIATVVATAVCAVPVAGWATCGVAQAAAWGVRTQQRAANGGGWRRTAGASAGDALVTGATFGLGSALRFVRYGSVGGPWFAGAAKKVASWTSSSLWQRTVVYHSLNGPYYVSFYGGQREMRGWR